MLSHQCRRIRPGVNFGPIESGVATHEFGIDMRIGKRRTLCQRSEDMLSILLQTQVLLHFGLSSACAALPHTVNLSSARAGSAAGGIPQSSPSGQVARRTSSSVTSTEEKEDDRRRLPFQFGEAGREDIAVAGKLDLEGGVGASDEDGRVGRDGDRDLRTAIRSANLALLCSLSLFRRCLLTNRKGKWCREYAVLTPSAQLTDGPGDVSESSA